MGADVSVDTVDTGFIVSAVVLTAIQTILFACHIAQFYYHRPTLLALSRLQADPVATPATQHHQLISIHTRAGDVLIEHERTDHLPVLKHYLHVFGICYGLLRVPCCIDKYGAIGLLPVQMDEFIAPWYTAILIEELSFLVYFSLLALYKQIKHDAPPVSLGILFCPVVIPAAGVIAFALEAHTGRDIYELIVSFAELPVMIALWVVMCIVTVELHRRLETFRASQKQLAANVAAAAAAASVAASASAAATSPHPPAPIAPASGAAALTLASQTPIAGAAGVNSSIRRRDNSGSSITNPNTAASAAVTGAPAGSGVITATSDRRASGTIRTPLLRPTVVSVQPHSTAATQANGDPPTPNVGSSSNGSSNGNGTPTAASRSAAPNSSGLAGIDPSVMPTPKGGSTTIAIPTVPPTPGSSRSPAFRTGVAGGGRLRAPSTNGLSGLLGSYPNHPPLLHTSASTVSMDRAAAGDRGLITALQRLWSVFVISTIMLIGSSIFLVVHIVEAYSNLPGGESFVRPSAYSAQRDVPDWFQTLACIFVCWHGWEAPPAAPNAATLARMLDSAMAARLQAITPGAGGSGLGGANPSGRSGSVPATPAGSSFVPRLTRIISAPTPSHLALVAANAAAAAGSGGVGDAAGNGSAAGASVTPSASASAVSNNTAVTASTPVILVRAPEMRSARPHRQTGVTPLPPLKLFTRIGSNGGGMSSTTPTARNGSGGGGSSGAAGAASTGVSGADATATGGAAAAAAVGGDGSSIPPLVEQLSDASFAMPPPPPPLLVTSASVDGNFHGTSVITIQSDTPLTAGGGGGAGGGLAALPAIVEPASPSTHTRSSVGSSSSASSTTTPRRVGLPALTGARSSSETNPLLPPIPDGQLLTPAPRPAAAGAAAAADSAPRSGEPDGSLVGSTLSA